MIVYYSMIIWIGVTWIIAMLSPELAFEGRRSTRKVKLGYAIFTMMYIILIAGLRNSVGDTYTYIKIFNGLPTNIGVDFLEDYTKDRGFFALSILFKKFISDNYTWWLLLISLLSGVWVAKVLSKYSHNFFFSMYLFITMVHFVWMLNGMRQFIAVCGLFASIDFVREQKFIKLTIVTLLLSTIHITAIIMIPVYFLAIAKPWGKQFWILLIGILICGMSIDAIANTFSYALEDSAYDGYLTAAATSSGSNILRTAVAISPPILAYICKKYTTSENDKIINISVNMSCLSAVLYYCSSLSGGILVGRLPIYFDMYNLLLLPWLVEHSFTERSKRIAYIALMIAYFVFFYSKVKVGMNMGYSSNILGIYV